MTNRKGEPFGETAKTYAKEIVLTRMGFELPDITTWQMEWGIEWESTARDIYSDSRNLSVVMPGFIKADFDTENVGATPDGIVINDELEKIGLLEIKCPQWKAHLDYLLNGIPKQYWQQVQFQMMVTDLPWCDFMTFHPDFPDNLKAKVIRVKRDQDFIDLIKERIVLFKELINQIEEQLKNL